jgi:hypothetical protein
MTKKKICVTILILLGILFFLIGGLVMHKKMVKEEVFASQEIDYILLDGNVADITIIQSKTNDIKITQYSMKKIEKSMEYHSEISNGILNIKDNSGQVDWFMGIKGSAGISFEIQVPVNKTVELKVDLNKGNLQIVDLSFNSVEIAINKSGNIDVSNVVLKSTSEIYTHAGDIDIKFSSDSDSFEVNAIVVSGNKNIDKKYFEGEHQLKVQSDKGNISVK